MTLLLGVLAASVVGSIHCAAMCGAFVCLYSGMSAPRGISGLSSHVAYNLGRLASYLTLGLVAGAIGSRIDAAAMLAGVGRGAAIVAGTLMVAWAVSNIASSFGVRGMAIGTPTWARQRLGGFVVATRSWPREFRAAATGLVTTLLPCGWLYTFVVTAGGTGHPLSGALVMAAFWAGTVPLMLGLGLGLHRTMGPVARRLPAASAALVLLLGLLSIAGKVGPTPSPSENARGGHAQHATR